MELATDPENWNNLKAVITRTTGFQTENYTESFLKRRVDCRLRVLNLKSYAEYSKLLITTPAEKDPLLKELTIHVTNFFRDKEMYDVFFAQTIMELLKRKEGSGDKSIRVWSAGASTGEEAYSVAIMISEILGERLKDFNIRIIATDLDAPTIEKAKLGHYEEIQMKEVPEDYKKRYFDTESDLFKVKDSIKKMIDFKVGDILNPLKPKNIDILFCRNTVIYFEKDVKEKLYSEFASCINSGGYFVMGKTETLSGPAKDMFDVVDTRERIYRKLDKAVSVVN